MKKKIIKITAALFITLFFLVFYLILSSDMRINDKKLREYFKSRSIELNLKYIKGIRSFGIRSFKDSAFTVLFVHGAPGSGDQFKSYLADSSLLSIANVMSYDRPGYGFSNYGKVETDLKKQADALRNVIEHSIDSSQKLILVSHSYGGPIAAYLCADGYTKIHSHIMLCPVIDPYHEKEFWYSGLPLWWPFRYFSSPSMKVAAHEKLNHAKSLEKIETAWKQIKVPTLHIQGGEDWLAPIENADYVKEKFDSRFVEITILEDHNHFIPFTNKNLIIQLIMDNINS